MSAIPVRRRPMIIRKALSIFDMAFTGFAAKRLRGQRRHLADQRKRGRNLSELLCAAIATLRSIDRELTFGCNPPGSGKGSVSPKATLSEMVALRDRSEQLKSRSADLPPQTGAIAYIQIKAALAETAAVEADVVAFSNDVNVFRSRVRLARDSGERLP